MRNAIPSSAMDCAMAFLTFLIITMTKAIAVPPLATIGIVVLVP